MDETPDQDETPDKPRDEMVEAEVERALRLYQRILPKKALAALEEMVRDLLENDPTAVELLAAARPHKPPLQTTGEETPPGPSKKPADES